MKVHKLVQYLTRSITIGLWVFVPLGIIITFSQYITAHVKYRLSAHLIENIPLTR